MMLQDPLAFPSRQSDTRCQRNTCRANEHLCNSGRPLIQPKACHKTSQWARRMQKPHDTCFCVSYHFSIICISFISQTQSCEPAWQACSLSYEGRRERETQADETLWFVLFWHRWLTTCNAVHWPYCVRTEREMNTSWVGGGCPLLLFSLCFVLG